MGMHYLIGRFRLLAVAITIVLAEHGDFSGNGTVDTIDFNILAANFAKSLPSSGAASVTIVPEPMSIAIGMLGFSLCTRERRGRAGRR